ncbi:oligosaccharide flippase family protein [Paraburkholderia sprentiae WSM5005]|uniref:Oligosaccharide flippase family protein n=1 Tax=Paraburkholderia sprentiae WSM5005 TaxID=754502 RepID=A0A1I9YHB7_9BURK|nr:oligosaccharide flippase family protein [Paraburkholderia sprentiae]APA85700.1 oligosaccharide flippase family protein [Paraburkholderia sprentiae WSM5005]
MSTRNVIIALYSVYALNYVLPLVTLPYLSHVLGPAGLGVIGYAQSIAQILLVVVDFGFGLSSARKVAVHIDQPEVVNRIYWSTTIGRAVLALLCSLVLVGWAFAAHMSPQERGATLLGSLVIWGGVLTPGCFYEGTQRLPVLAGTLLAARVGLLIPLFLFVKTRDDVMLAAAFQYAPTFVCGLVLTGTLIWKREILLTVRVGWSDVMAEAKEAYHIFLGSALTSVYMYANVIMLRMISGPGAVGYYVAAERLTNALRACTAPAIQAFFPKICVAYERNDFAYIHKVNRGFMLAFAASAVLILVGFTVLGEWFVGRFLGEAFGETFRILRILVFVPAIVGMTTTQVMLTIIASGNQSLLKRIYVYGALFHLVQAPISIYLWGGVGTACSVAATELFMLIGVYNVSSRINHGQIAVRAQRTIKQEMAAERD